MIKSGGCKKYKLLSRYDCGRKYLATTRVFTSIEIPKKSICFIRVARDSKNLKSVVLKDIDRSFPTDLIVVRYIQCHLFSPPRCLNVPKKCSGTKLIFMEETTLKSYKYIFGG